MAKKVIWSNRALLGFERVINYLEKDWTIREIEKFIQSTQRTIEQIQSGTIKFRASKKKNIYEVPITKHNLLIYRALEEQIELLVFYDTRQHPKKKKF